MMIHHDAELAVKRIAAVGIERHRVATGDKSLLTQRRMAAQGKIEHVEFPTAAAGRLVSAGNGP